MKITIEQYGIKATIEYHDDIDVHQLGALLYGACLSVGWSEANLDHIFKPEEFDYSFQKLKS